MIRAISVFIALFISAVSMRSLAQDLVFLSIGLENYAELGERSGSPGTRKFENPPSGNHSGSRIAYNLAQRARWGLLLQDEPDRYVTRDDIWTAVHEALKKATAYDDPIFILYFNGHGVGEGLANAQFLVPGDFIGPYPIDDLIDAEEQLVHALGVLELIAEAKIPYLVMLDTCYEGQPQRFEDTFVPELEEFGNNIANILLFMNSQYPAVRAAEPMDFAISITDPDPRFFHKSVGPLARRFLLAADELGSGEIEMGSLIGKLASATLDLATNRPTIQPEDYAWTGNLPALRQPIQFEVRAGTGRAANTLVLDEFIADANAEAEQGLATHYVLSQQPSYALVSLLAGSFGQGRPATIGKVDDPTDTVFASALRNVADFSTSDSDVSSFSYDFPRAMLAHMPSQFELMAMDRWDDNPGIGLSFRGTSCEVVEGSASNVITTVDRGVLQTLAMGFEVTCENGLTAKGTMDVIW